MSDNKSLLLEFIKKNNGIGRKSILVNKVAAKFNLTKDRSVYYCDDYAIRFSSSATPHFANTVLSLSRLQKYDNRPFIVCLVTPANNHCFLANSTFLTRISHSSQKLRVNNIRGSFNGSDIIREFEGIVNSEDNLDRLFAIHAEIGFEGNLVRLVEATNNISPQGAKYQVKESDLSNILSAPKRARAFVKHKDYRVLKNELDRKVSKFKTEIMLAALIENVNVRGRVIEYLIAGEDESLRQQLISALKNKKQSLPAFRTENTLGDYHRKFDKFNTETDVKTKIIILNSNPKAYNIDKMLEFLSSEASVFMFYFIGIDPGKIINTVLISMFQKDLLRSTILLRHWSGRNSRGVTQFEGKAINDLISKPDSSINEKESVDFLKHIIGL